MVKKGSLCKKYETKGNGAEMKQALIFLISAGMLFFTACGSGSQEETIYTEVNTQEGISLTLQEGTLKGASGTFILSNDTEEAVTYSAHEYHLEQLKEGRWVESSGTAEANWGEETAQLQAGEEVELSFNWKAFLGNTTKGTQYRLIILVDEGPVAAEFTGA